MKKNIFITFLGIISIISYGQNTLLDCRDLSNPDYPEPPLNIFTKSINAVPPASNKYVFNVKFHIVKNTDGSGNTATFGETEVMNAIMILNTSYNQYNIFFKYVGFDVIQDSQYMNINSQTGVSNVSSSDLTFGQLITYSKTGMTNPVYDYNAFNVFIVDKLDKDLTTGLAQTAGVAHKPGNNSALSYNYFLTSSLPHEIAHNFGLHHTHQGYNTINCEQVYGDVINHETKGDLVLDTPASHPLTDSNNTSSCGYQNLTNITDCTGAVYINVPVKNFMSYNNSCRQLGSGYLPGNAHFTNGQANRMREIIDAYINNSANTYGYYQSKNTIESLYEPFETSTALGGVASVTDNTPGDGMANVCRYILGINHRFQKGFTYNFSNIYDGSAISSNTVSELPNITASFIQGIQITQIDSSIKQFGPACTRGYHCELEPYVGGKITSTGMIGSNLYTEEELDEIKVKDPLLYQNLTSNTYNIITKETSSGAVNQKIIYKN